MDEPLFKLLDYLAPKGIGVLDNIADPLSKIFVVTDSTDVSTEHEAKKLMFFLDNLIAENLIGMPDRPDASLGERHPSQGYRWLIDWPIGAWITLNGFNLLREEKLRREGKDLESSVKKTNQFIQDNSRATLGVAILALVISGIGLFKGCNSERCCEPQNQQITIPHTIPQSEADTLKKSLFELRNTLNELKSVLAKDTTQAPVLRTQK